MHHHRMLYDTVDTQTDSCKLLTMSTTGSKYNRHHRIEKSEKVHCWFKFLPGLWEEAIHTLTIVMELWLLWSYTITHSLNPCRSCKLFLFLNWKICNWRLSAVYEHSITFILLLVQTIYNERSYKLPLNCLVTQFISNWTKTKRTHQATAQVPVSSEWTRDTERFLHFHVLQGSVSTMPGLGTVCRNLWRILKVTEQKKTYRAGCFCTSFSHASIVHTLLCVSDGESFLCCFLADLNFLCPFQESPHESHSDSWNSACFLPVFPRVFRTLRLFVSILHVLVPVIGVVSVTVPACWTLIGRWWICLWECDNREWWLYFFALNFLCPSPCIPQSRKNICACSDAVVSTASGTVNVCVWVSEWVSGGAQ